MFAAKKLLEALLLPPVGLVLLALAGLAISARARRLGTAIAALALIVVLTLSLPVVAVALNRGLYPPPLSEQALSGAQAIVILGGGMYPDAPEFGGDSVGGATLERIHYGVYLQARTGLPILVTGGAPFGGRPEGEAMRQIIERDFHARVAWTESRSRDTAENARYSAALLQSAGISRIVLVTNAWHMRRAVHEFERTGLQVTPAPTVFLQYGPAGAALLPSADALLDSNRALHEWLGLLAQKLGVGASG
jgi:uncharacterized SAM-binding protein YcdF (DUF218 family)